MQILSSELVAETSQLPSIVLALTAAVGPMLWGMGWRIHRALFVAASTVVGGLYGLAHGPSLGLYPIVAAGLLSLSAGGLALAILRIGVFVVFGAVLDFLASAAFASHMDEQSRGWVRALAFLLGGLLSLACYRFLIITLTSFAGAFLILLGGLAFVARNGEADTVALVANQSGLVTAAFILMGLIGTTGQYLLERQRARERRERARDPTAELLRKILKAKSPRPG